jgi:ABC-type sugar transport system ATPase subunit
MLTLSHITKTYPGVVALDDVSLSFAPGTVHALMGENGAGKSTLIKVISGAIKPDSGTIDIDGETFKSMTPALSAAKKIAVIYQDILLVPALGGREHLPRAGFRSFLLFKEETRKSRSPLKRIRIES